jgi:hypothetical protein
MIERIVDDASLLSIAIDDSGSIGYSFEHNQVKSNASITIHNHNYACPSFESVACSVKVQTGLCCNILFMLMCVCVCVCVCLQMLLVCVRFRYSGAQSY